MPQPHRAVRANQRAALTIIQAAVDQSGLLGLFGEEGSLVNEAVKLTLSLLLFDSEGVAAGFGDVTYHIIINGREDGVKVLILRWGEGCLGEGTSNGFVLFASFAADV